MLQLERPLKKISPASQRPLVDVGCEGKGKFYHVPQWEFGCFLISVLSSHGAHLQQDGGQCPSPGCSSSQAKEGLATHLLCSLWQLHPGAPVLLHVCVTSPAHHCWLLFDRENCFSENFQVTFQSDGSWKDTWKKGSANKDMFLTWLWVLFLFLPAGPWVTAAVLLRWESSNCSSCFFPKHV